MSATWLLYGATTSTSSGPIVDRSPAASVQPTPCSECHSSATADASSGDAAIDGCTCSTNRTASPLARPSTATRSRPAADSSRPSYARSDTNAVSAGCIRYVRSRKTPRSSGTVGCPSSRCSSAESPDSPGCTACVGCASCCGSPSSTSDVPARATATALASENCPASSITSTSTASARSSRHQNHDVPPTSDAEPSSSREATSPASRDHSTPGAPHAWDSSHFCSAGRPTALSTLPITAWDCAVTPTFLPASSSARISRDAARVLPLPGGPCTASTSPFKESPNRTTASPASSPGSRRVSAGTTRSSSRCPRHGSPARTASAVAVVAARSCSDRKSTRLNSSHAHISYAVFCLKKKQSRGPESLAKGLPYLRHRDLCNDQAGVIFG